MLIGCDGLGPDLMGFDWIGLRMEATEYRKLQLAAVTGYSGTSEREILLITSWPLFALLLWHLYFEALADSLHSTMAKWLVEFLLFLVPQIVLFLFPQYASALIMVSLLYVVVLVGRRSSGSRTARYNAIHKTTGQDPAVTNARASIMSMCTLGILAVDFRAFPRRFVKTETFGTSLMDVGVGTVVFSMGMMSARHWINLKTRPVTLLGRLFPAMKSTLPLFVLGLLRMLLVKGVNYQEHFSEYGIHWNFFVTLGALPILMTLFLEFFSLQSSFHLGLGLCSLYQACLSRSGLQEFLFSSHRTGLIAMNKEGIVSLVGYFGLTLMSLAVGVQVFTFKNRDRGRFYTRLATMMLILGLVYCSCKHYFYILPSRRLVCIQDMMNGSLQVARSIFPLPLSVFCFRLLNSWPWK